MCFNTSALSICKHLPLNAAKKIKIKDNSSGMKINPKIDRVFRTLEMVGGIFTLVRKAARKTVYLSQMT